MKIRIDQLAGQLKKGIAPIYIVSGDEPQLVMECCDGIRSVLQKAGFSERHRLSAWQQGFDWQQLWQQARSLSLFASRKLIEIHLNSGKGPTQAGRTVLQHYARQPVADNVLLLVTPRLEKSTLASKWFKALEQPAVWIPIWPLDAQQRVSWVRQRLQKARLQADHEAITLLVERTEGNLLAAAQAIEKLTLNPTGQTISSQQVLDQVSDNARYDVFGWVDSLLAGQSASGLKILARLRTEGIDPVALLWPLAHQLRLLIDIADHMRQGATFASALEYACKQHKGSLYLLKKRQNLLQASLQRHRPRQLRHMLTAVHRIDQSIKGMLKQPVWDQITELAAQIAGTPISFVNETT